MFENKSCLIISRLWDSYMHPTVCGVIEPGDMQTLFCVLKSLFGDDFTLSYTELLAQFEATKASLGAEDIWDTKVVEGVAFWLEDENESLITFDEEDYYTAG